MDKRSVAILMVVAVILNLIMGAPGDCAAAVTPLRRIAVKDYVDKMKAGWIGQMAGVGWAGPTEFRFKGLIMPEDKVPNWHPKRINQFRQDDIYVEMTFLRTLELHGFDVSIRQAGIDFANSQYGLAHANRAGRDNLRRGIAPPDSGHPKFNRHADDIDYQIEADYAGLIAPGLPNLTIDLGEKFGRLMNYGDGMYAGQFIGGMYTEAFFEDDMVKIVEVGLRCIPEESQYAEMVRDMLAWYQKNPDDWEKTWQWCEDKYHKDAGYTHGLCSTPGGEDEFTIDAKLNGAYILIGLLYGKGDPDQTIIISTRCGQDSDCNPSNAGGILFTTIGFSKLPEKFKSALNPESKFRHTPYNFPTLINVCEKLVRQAVKRAGGRIEKNANGEEVFVIPARKPGPSRLERSWEPDPVANSRFTADELDHLKPTGLETEKAESKNQMAKLLAAICIVALIAIISTGVFLKYRHSLFVFFALKSGNMAYEKDDTVDVLRTFYKTNEDNMTKLENWIANDPEMKQYMKDNNVSTISLTSFIRAEAFSEARKRAAKALGLGDF
jgi:hypothetical protein